MGNSHYLHEESQAARIAQLMAENALLKAELEALQRPKKESSRQEQRRLKVERSAL